jgi:hypothetical protein
MNFAYVTIQCLCCVFFVGFSECLKELNSELADRADVSWHCLRMNSDRFGAKEL